MDTSLLNKDEKYLSWAPEPEERKDCPKGLQVLSPFPEFWLIQHKSLKKELTKLVDTKYKFSLQTSVKERVFFLEEVGSKTTERALWGSDREFTIEAKNERMEPVLTFHRPFKAKAAFFSWLNTTATGWHIEVVGVKKEPIGVVQQVSSSMHKRFDLVDKDRMVRLHIKGPLMESRLWKEDIDFKIFLPDRETQVGKIAIKWAGMKKEMMEALEFHLKIGEGRTEVEKALVLAATLLIRFMVSME